jgi:hypothetical protein
MSGYAYHGQDKKPAPVISEYMALKDKKKIPGK